MVEAKKLPKCDPYCIVAFDDGKEVGRTHFLDKEANPVWDKKFTLYVFIFFFNFINFGQ